MENKSISHFITGGVIGGTLVLYTVILMIFDQMGNSSLALISMALIIGLLIYFIIMHGKSKNNLVTFGNLFAYGFKSTAFATVILLAFNIILNYLMPELKDKYFEVSMQKMMENPQVTEEMAEKSLDFMRKFYWPFLIAGTVFSTIIMGAIGSLIGAAVTKKTPSNPFQNA